MPSFMELIKQMAEIYIAAGLSVIPVGQDKIPIGKWKAAQESITQANFDACYGLGIVAGKVSGYTQIVDIDTKYDLTGSLYQDYKELIASNSKELLRKLVVQQTPSGGYHFIFKCKDVEGNKKLANRHATDEEKKSTNEKIKVLIETRGEGGYFAVYPFPNYKIIYGSLEKIKEIAPEEKNILWDCAKVFNQVYETPYEKKEHKKVYTDNLSPFEDYNNRADVLDFLQVNGWKLTLQRGNKNLLLRPGGTGKWSADWDSEKRIFFCFTSSSEFESMKGYNPSQVLTKIKFNGDPSASAKWLITQGYGEKSKTISSQNFKSTISTEDENFDFVATNDETDSYIEQIRNGTFQQGLSTGFPDLDNHWRFKPANLDIILGHDNVGKSLLMWYLSVVSAKLHGWKWIIYSSENKLGGIKAKLCEFYICKRIKDMTDKELSDSKKWVEENFTIIRNKQLFNYMDMMNMGKKLLAKKSYNAFLIDPYNSLDPDDSANKHDFDYRVMSQFRVFIEQTNCSIFLNIHAVTEALRRVYPKNHKYEGYPMPPKKSDAEGGGKFANKADNLMTVHRLVQHPDDWMWTEIHVLKIKELETGGKHTFLDCPVRLRMVKGSCGFENIDGVNPVTGNTTPIVYSNSIINQSRHNPDKFTESVKVEDMPEELPF